MKLATISGMSWWAVRAAGCAALVTSISLNARADSLRVDRSAETMRVDGALREWKGARFATLGEGDDASLRYALASKDEGLYLAAEVHDDQLVRRAAAGAGQDALVLAIAAPAERGGARVSEVWLHAGRAGREKALAGLASASGARVSALAEVSVVEGPLSSGAGYVLEAFIPWRVVADAERWEQVRATLRYEDHDRVGQKAPDATLASSRESRPSDWPLITLGAGQVDLLANFVEAQGLGGATLRFDARADVAGDAHDERVVIVDKYVLVYGKHFKDGQSYSFFALPFSVGGGLVSAELIDLTDDGRAELLTRVRQSNALGARVFASVLALGEERIAPLLSLELKKETRAGFIENELTIDKKARPKQLTLSQGRTQGLTPENYRESPASDAVPILLPWGEIEAQSYAFVDGKFTRVAQREKKRAPEAAIRTSAPAASAATAPSEVRASSGDPIADLVQALAGGAQTPAGLRFKQEANLIGGPARELVFVQQRRIVLSGADLGAPGAYLAYGLPVRADEDLLRLECADVNKDGKAELLARYRQTSADGVGHELLVVLAVSGDERGFRPILLAEVARRQGTKAIVNQVNVSGGALVIAPGKPEGYTRDSYPFDNEPMPGIERLLLPWLDGERRYRFEAGRLRAD